MERLRGIDAGFLYMETPTLHMHTLKVAVLDPSNVPGGYSFGRFKDELGARLHLLPPFRRRLVDVPLGFHHPVWIEDPDFDLDYHVRRAGVARPGGSREMDRAISEIAGHQLDRRRPLWQLWMLEGLAGGRLAFVAKIHHAAADGVAAAALLANVMATQPDVVAAEPPDRPWAPDTVPAPRRLMADAFADHLGQIRRVPGLVAGTVGNLRAVRRRRQEADVSPPLPFETPRTAFNAGLTPHRSFATTDLSLDDVKAVKRELGGTVNDVVLALVTGALRHVLSDDGQLPDRPLVAGVPVSTDRPEEQARLGGNKVSNMFTALPVEVADPVERLRAISEVTKAAKEVHNLLGAEMLQDWTEYTPPRPYAWLMRQYSRLNLADRHRPPINLVVSNVPGPTEPLYVAGAKLEAIYSVGPILEGIGLNVTVWSYLGRMHVGLLACPEHVPDLHRVTDAVQRALAELQEAAGTAPAPPVSFSTH